MPLQIENFLIFSGMYILLCWATFLPYRCGQLYMGTIYCMAAGGYFTAYSGTVWGWPLWISLLSSPIVGGVFAFFPAIGLRKAPGFTVAIASLALVFIIQTVIRNLDFLGGQGGFFGIPPMENILFVTCFIVIIAGIVVHRIDHSRLGRAAENAFYNVDVAVSTGVNIGSLGIFFQTMAGSLSGIAGGIFALNVGSVFPAAFGPTFLLNVMVMFFLGGSMTMWGAVVFAPILWGFPQILPESIAGLKDIIYGGLLIGILIFRPEGVITKSTIRAIDLLPQKIADLKD